MAYQPRCRVLAVAVGGRAGMGGGGGADLTFLR